MNKLNNSNININININRGFISKEESDWKRKYFVEYFRYSGSNRVYCLALSIY